MANDSNVGVRATKGQVGPNRGGTHGGINPNGSQMSADGITAHGSTGNPGTEFAWEGPDSTQIGANTQLPPLTHLGGGDESVT